MNQQPCRRASGYKTLRSNNLYESLHTAYIVTLIFKFYAVFVKFAVDLCFFAPHLCTLKSLLHCQNALWHFCKLPQYPPLNHYYALFLIMHNRTFLLFQIRERDYSLLLPNHKDSEDLARILLLSQKILQNEWLYLR